MEETDRKAAVEAASRAKVSTAIWLGSAIREKVGREREDLMGEVEVELPGGNGATVASVGTERGNSHNGRLHELVQMARAMTPPDKDSAAMRLARSIVHDQLKALRGTEEPTRSEPKRLAAPTTVETVP